MPPHHLRRGCRTGVGRVDKVGARRCLSHDDILFLIVIHHVRLERVDAAAILRLWVL